MTCALVAAFALVCFVVGPLRALFVLRGQRDDLEKMLGQCVEAMELRCGETGWDHDPDVLRRARALLTRLGGGR